MKQKTILFLMALIPFLIYSQIATMKQSEPIKALNGRTHKINLYLDEKENIVLQPFIPVFMNYNVAYSGNVNNGSLAIASMSKNGEFKSYQIHKYSKTAYELNQTFKFGTKIVAILEMYDKGTDTYHLAYSIIEGSNIKSEQAQKLCSFPVEKKRQRNVTVLVSADKKHFALVNEVYERKEDPAINCAVFDEDFKLVWKQNNLKIRAKYPEYSIENMILGDDNSIYIYFETYLKEKRMIVSFESSMLNISESGIEKDMVKFDNFLPAQSKIIQRGKDIMLIGFYINSGKDGLQGLFSCIYDPKDNNFSEVNQSKFTQSIVNDVNFEPDYKGKKQLTVTNFQINNILPQADGSMIMFSEESEIQIVTTYNSKGGSRTDYYYTNYCILYSKITKNGEFEWVKILPKKQFSKNTSGSLNSYSIHQGENGIYLFYNDHTDNLAANIGDFKTTSKRKNNIYCVKIDPNDGNYKKQHLLGNENKKFWFFHEIVSLSPNKVAFIAIKGKKKTLCTVDLK